MSIPMGAHVPAEEPLAEAAARGADLVQFFLSAPQTWKAPRPRDDAALLRAADTLLYAHAPYLINVATTNNRVRHPSRQSLQRTCEAAAAIGASGVIVHGGHVPGGEDIEDGYAHWRRTLERLETDVPLLIENTAGGDNAACRHVERILRLFEVLDGVDAPLGFCLDTCHLHAAGGDLGLVEGTQRLIDGIGRVDLVHCNDSRDPVGSGRDRHIDLRDGEIDPEALVEVVRICGAPVVLETPGGAERHAADIAWLRERL